MGTLLQLYWLWILVGATLFAAYAWQGPLLVAWLAGGAAFVALLPVPLPDFANPIQLLIWLSCSALYVVAWFLFVKPLEPDKSEPASVKSVLLGETGLVLRAPSQETGGMIRFSSPLLGSEDWPIIPLDEVKEGDLVTVVDLLGKSLVVRKS